jgi:hypothetical protein
MKLKVVSDGTRAGTKVVDEDGREVEGVVHVEWSWGHDEYGGLPRATIKLEGVPLETPDEADKHVL